MERTSPSPAARSARPLPTDRMPARAHTPPARRVILVVVDGLRPDAIDRYELSHVRRLADSGASSLNATTVSPSVTTAAMTSLLTGVSPDRHGIQSDHLFIPRAASSLSPLPQVLAQQCYPSAGFMAQVPALLRGVAARIGRRLGFSSIHVGGSTAAEILARARSTIRTQRRGLILLHWPDADRAGHDRGWMSPAYADGCLALDRALGELSTIAEVPSDPHTMMIVLADHGGGGVRSDDHESEHPLDKTIPLIAAGGNIVPQILDAASLLDVPPTILRALGVDVPPSYEGRALSEIIAVEHAEAVVA